MMVASVASAYSFGFTQITNNTNTAVASQLQVDVTNSDGDALFTFTNNVGIASSITQIYFDYGNTNYFTSLDVSGESSGVQFSDGANPANLPSGNTISFSADDAGSADSGPGGVTANGVNGATEWVSFLGSLLEGSSFDSVIAGLNSGAFRIGLHVQSIGGGTSDAFVNKTPNPVPLPAAVWLFGSALLGFTTLSNRRKKLD